MRKTIVRARMALNSRDNDLARRCAPELKARKSPRRRRSNYGSRAARNINSYIHAKSRGEDRWWDRNKQVVEYLDQGLSVQEIAGLTERGPRQIRTIRERLADLRAAA